MALDAFQVKELEKPAARFHKNTENSKIAETKLNQIQRMAFEFQAKFSSHKGKYIASGLSCVAVIFFDYIISHKTMGWVANLSDFPVEVIALIFTVLDSAVAILASGIFADGGGIGKVQAKRLWTKVLIGLGVFKIVMFVTFVRYVYAESGDSDWLMTFLMVGFVSVVYVVLHFAGEGLGYVSGSSWYKFKEFIAANPSDFHKAAKKAKAEFYKRIAQHNIPKIDAQIHFNIDVADGIADSKPVLNIADNSNESDNDNIQPVYSTN